MLPPEKSETNLSNCGNIMTIEDPVLQCSTAGTNFFGAHPPVNITALELLEIVTNM